MTDSVSTPEAPRIVHSLPGRVRVHVPAISGAASRRLEAQLHRTSGVVRVRASPRTANVLVEFDRTRVDAQTIVARLTRLAARAAAAGSERRPARPRTTGAHVRESALILEARASARRVRVAVRGLDRDPELGRRLVEQLGRSPDVQHVSPSQLTGRVLVELEEGTESIQGILDQIADLEPPAADSEEEVPAHPLDPAPIIESGAKAIGAMLGLLVLAGRRAAGAAAAPVDTSGPGEVAATIGLVESVPQIAQRIEDALGHQRKQLLFGALLIASTSASGNALGLAFAGAGAVRLLTESVARRRAWREYERRLGDQPAAYPGAVLTLASGQRTPLAATVVHGFGVASALDGSPQPLHPGAAMDPGARVYGGSVTVELRSEAGFHRAGPRSPPPATALDRYSRWVAYLSLLYAATTGVVTRSPLQSLTALLLINPIPALVGRESADQGASARVVRAGVTVVGSRPARAITRPDVLVIDEPRALCSGWELRRSLTVVDTYRKQDVLALAGAISIAAGSPWGIIPSLTGPPTAADGTFDGRAASAEIDGERWLLEPEGEQPVGLDPEPDEQVLVVRRQRDGLLAGALSLRPRVTQEVRELLDTCRARDVLVELATRSPTPRAQRVARRAAIELIAQPAEARVQQLHDHGRVVAVVGDSTRSAAAFEQCDLAIGLTSGQSGSFQARADLLAPTLEAVAAIIEAAGRRDAAVRDGVLASAAANLGGAAWGIWRRPPFRLGTRPAQLGGLAAIADSTARLWGGRRSRTVTERLSDPLPERWGRENTEDVLRQLRTTRDGLSSSEAQQRWRPRLEVNERGGLSQLVLEQLSSPLVAVLGFGAAFSAAIGAMGDVVLIVSVVAANAIVGVWQERRAGAAASALHELSASTARVIRDGRQVTVPHTDLVPGDVILLASGDRVPADARVLSADALEVDEASLSGESIPLAKSADDGSESGRIVLEGTGVTTGTGRAVVVAVGEQTRMGAITAALAEYPDRQNPLDERLGHLLMRGLPLIAAGGLIVTAAGVLWGKSPLSQLALGASVAIAAVPEGLPLLAGTAEAAVAHRLAQRNALVTRLAAVETLGRVDVACVDKTGTLTSGTLALTLVADASHAQASAEELTPSLEHVLRAAAFASPSPGALDAASHPTDVAVLEGARAAGLDEGLRSRQAESRFDPTRSFHATRANGTVWLKGAVEAVAERCTRVRLDDRPAPIRGDGRQRLLDRAAELAGHGLRILLVAEGPGDASVEDPQGLTALGFVGISDPLRAGAADAVVRCREAGVRVVMLTGDHPVTAKAIARQARLPADEERILTGGEIAGLDDDTLAERLVRTTIIARTTPLDKLRIVEALRGAGHVVAMTGDGVNDAPALRLADVGVAMGRGGTEVARQAADLVLIDDDISTLAEALVEGRGFWHNMRRALGLLLGGNAGEVALMAAAALTGRASPLTTRQVLTVNLVTDVLPAVSVAVQPPEHRNLAELSREGGTALDAPLRADIVRRAVGTGASSLGAYLLASRTLAPGAARSVAYLSIVTTQLAQTVDLGQAEGRLTAPVLGAVAGSLGVVGISLAVPGLRSFLGLASPTPAGILIAGGASVLAVAVARTLPVRGSAPDLSAIG